MWIPTKTARELDIFFLGYMKARKDLGVPEYGTDEDAIREEFQDWICAKLGLDTRVGWVHCVEQIDNQPDNVGTFLSLFEEFLAAKGQALPEADVERWVGTDSDGDYGNDRVMRGIFLNGYSHATPG